MNIVCGEFFKDGKGTRGIYIQKVRLERKEIWICEIETLKENFFLAGLQFISVRYLGDNLVLLTEEDDTDMKKVIEESSEWLSMVFTSLQPWTKDIASGHKIVWVRCRGIPLSLWNEKCFPLLTASVGTLIDIDKIQ